MPTRNRAGFTLVELMIVVVIIGIIAVIAMSNFANSRDKALIATMKSDLRNLTTAEEAYFSDNASYAGGTASNISGAPVALQGFVPSPGVRVTATATGGTGWSAIASHTGTSKTCSIFLGVTAVAPATSDGEPGCT